MTMTSRVFPSNWSLTDWGIVFTLLFTLLWTYYLLKASDRPNFPPGPALAFFIRESFHLGSEPPEVVLQKWAAKFGDVMFLHLLGKPVVILSSEDVSRDLLDKRSSIYSDRPRIALWELMGWLNATSALPYGTRLRRHHRLIHSILNEHSMKTFHPVQEQETIVLLQGFRQSPGEFVSHFKRFSAATIFAITYGQTITSVDHQFVRLADRVASLLVAEGMLTPLLVDFFPALKYLPTWAPFAGFKRRALETRKAVDDMINIPFDIVKDAMRAGTARQCFVSSLLEAHYNSGKQSADTEEEDDIKWAAGTLYLGGEDTTVCVLESFMLAMVRYPEVYKKAQEEMDHVVGNGRLPSHDDRDSLPYLDCVLKEVLRWNPPAPLATHRVMEDDIYRGYHIPAGATVIPNLYAMLQACPQPNAFRPERFIENPETPDPRELIFGFGRRICPGRHLAESNLWYLIANITATFEISRATDDDGKEIIPPFDIAKGLLRYPKPFSCSISPRSESLIPDI